MLIRIYSPTIGSGSLAIVGAAIRDVVDSMGMLAGFVPIDIQPGEGETFPGAEAPVALVMSPRAAGLAARHGRHEHTVLEFAPNSRGQPKSLIAAGRSMGVDRVITPSQWGKQVLLESWGDAVPIDVVPHGVDARFRVLPKRKPSVSSKFTILHHVVSAPERKGPLELMRAVEAWGRADVELQLSCSIETTMQIARSEEFRTAKRCVILAPFGARHPYPQPWPDCAIDQFSGCDVVCQPSRGEGFGMVPLEARACGVPVVMTTCTGHEEHAFLDGKLAPGIVHIDVREDAPMFCEMGGTAPTVDPDCIIVALEEAYTNFVELKEAALDAAEGVREKWSWTSQVGPWVEKWRNDEFRTSS